MDEEDPTFVSDEELRALNEERRFYGDGENPETEEQQLRRMFRESSAAAATTIIKIAAHGTNERTRLDAAKYVVERVIGKLGDDAYGGVSSPIDTFLDDVVEYVNNTSSHNGGNNGGNNGNDNKDS